MKTNFDLYLKLEAKLLELQRGMADAYFLLRELDEGLAIDLSKIEVEIGNIQDVMDERIGSGEYDA